MRCKYGLKARLLLEDGTLLEGCGFGASGVRTGEVVFTTSMYGYPELLTDPSYKGQILIMTHPMVGNYGVPPYSVKDPKSNLPLHFESDSIKVEGFVVAWVTEPNHWLMEKSLHEWLAEEGVPGIYGVDTRMLVRKLRSEGVMMGVIAVGEELPSKEELEETLERSPRYDEQDYIPFVVPNTEVIHGEGRKEVTVLDCGIKYGIIRELVRRGLRVRRVPCTKRVDLSNTDALLLGNGPGNPSVIESKYKVSKVIEDAIERKIPIMAICLGHQLLNITLGARVYKMKYGHRGVNKSALEVGGRCCYIVSENHGFAVDPKSVKGLKIWFINTDDRTLEGVRSEDWRIISTQFHPESSPGPNDTKWIFDKFKKVVINGETN